MTITAKNYAAQAIEGLKEFASRAAKHPYLSKDVEYIDQLYNEIKNAVHFVVQDGGRVFDDDLKGMEGREIRLPYPSITIEYFQEEPKELSEKAPVYFPKTVILAQEFDSDFFEKYLENWGVEFKCKKVILITYSGYSNGQWFPSMGCIAVPSNWDEFIAGGGIVDRIVEDSKIKHRLINGVPLPYLMNTCSFFIEQHEDGMNELKKSIAHDVSQEVLVVLELCEALTCTNVKISEFTKAADNNQKRIRRGKLPIYETKILTIEPSNISRSIISNGQSDRNSPKQHLRRGHIRRLENKNVWVNSCVVGDSKLGVINKTYNVQS